MLTDIRALADHFLIALPNINSALERSVDEDQHSDSTAMSAMFVMMKTYGGLECCLGCLSRSLLTVQDEKRQLQYEFDSEVERLQVELARVSLERDQAV
jgi:hypothetical protein